MTIEQKTLCMRREQHVKVSIPQPIQIQSPPEVDLMEEDEIVQRIPIFSSAGLKEKLCLLQFPLVNRDSSIDIQMAAESETTDAYSFSFMPAMDAYVGTGETRIIDARKVDFTQPMAVGLLKNGELHLSPIYKLYQGRPVMCSEKKTEIEGKAISWTELKSNTPFVAKSHDDITSKMSVGLFQSRICDTRSDTSVGMVANLSDDAIKSHSPKEQLCLYLSKAKTIFYDEFLKIFNLKAYAGELLEVLLKCSYFVQGRWTIKPEEIPEYVLPIELRLVRSFMIVLFALGKTLSTTEQIPKVIQLFGIDKTQLKTVLQDLAVSIKNSKMVSFRWRYNQGFEKSYPDIAEKGKEEILKLKEFICLAKNDEHLFDEFLQ